MPCSALTKEEAKKNYEAARLWIAGIEALKRKTGVRHAVLPVERWGDAALRASAALTAAAFGEPLCDAFLDHLTGRVGTQAA